MDKELDISIEDGELVITLFEDYILIARGAIPLDELREALEIDDG